MANITSSMPKNTNITRQPQREVSTSSIMKEILSSTPFQPTESQNAQLQWDNRSVDSSAFPVSLFNEPRSLPSKATASTSLTTLQNTSMNSIRQRSIPIPTNRCSTGSDSVNNNFTINYYTDSNDSDGSSNSTSESDSEPDNSAVHNFNGAVEMSTKGRIRVWKEEDSNVTDDKEDDVEDDYGFRELSRTYSGGNYYENDPGISSRGYNRHRHHHHQNHLSLPSSLLRAPYLGALRFPHVSGSSINQSTSKAVTTTKMFPSSSTTDAIDNGNLVGEFLDPSSLTTSLQALPLLPPPALQQYRGTLDRRNGSSHRRHHKKDPDLVDGQSYTNNDVDRYNNQKELLSSSFRSNSYFSRQRLISRNDYGSLRESQMRMDHRCMEQSYQVQQQQNQLAFGRMIMIQQQQQQCLNETDENEKVTNKTSSTTHKSTILLATSAPTVTSTALSIGEKRYQTRQPQKHANASKISYLTTALQLENDLPIKTVANQYEEDQSQQLLLHQGIESSSLMTGSDVLKNSIDTGDEVVETSSTVCSNPNVQNKIDIEEQEKKSIDSTKASVRDNMSENNVEGNFVMTGKATVLEKPSLLSSNSSHTSGHFVVTSNILLLDDDVSENNKIAYENSEAPKNTKSTVTTLSRTNARNNFDESDIVNQGSILNNVIKPRQQHRHLSSVTKIQDPTTTTTTTVAALTITATPVLPSSSSSSIPPALTGLEVLQKFLEANGGSCRDNNTINNTHGKQMAGVSNNIVVNSSDDTDKGTRSVTILSDINPLQQQLMKPEQQLCIDNASKLADSSLLSPTLVLSSSSTNSSSSCMTPASTFLFQHPRDDRKMTSSFHTYQLDGLAHRIELTTSNPVLSHKNSEMDNAEASDADAIVPNKNYNYVYTTNDISRGDIGIIPDSSGYYYGVLSHPAIVTSGDENKNYKIHSGFHNRRHNSHSSSTSNSNITNPDIEGAFDLDL